MTFNAVAKASASPACRNCPGKATETDVKLFEIGKPVLGSIV